MGRYQSQNSIITKMEKLKHLNQAYWIEAYVFVLEAVDYALKKLLKPRHLSAQELLRDIREYAYQQYGPMSALVFDKWQIHETLDFGQIVFDLIDVGLLRKQDDDSLVDFKEVREVEDIFQCRYEFDDVDLV